MVAERDHRGRDRSEQLEVVAALDHRRERVGQAGGALNQLGDAVAAEMRDGGPYAKSAERSCLFGSVFGEPPQVVGVLVA